MPSPKRSVAILGTRGYPSYYGGFETAVRKLAPFLVDAGWNVTVYGRRGSVKSDDADADARVESVQTHGIRTPALSTLTHGFTAALHAVIRPPSVALVMNVANGFVLPLLRLRGIPCVVNVDGIEWERGKWSWFARQMFFAGAKMTAKFANRLIFDAIEVERRWRADFNVTGDYIPYGGDRRGQLEAPLDLVNGSYILLVARFVPENSISEFFAAVPALAQDWPVVLVGTDHGGSFDEEARKLQLLANVQWLGHVSDDDLLHSLWQHAGVYFHGHSVGGTNPALVQAMALGAPVVARDTAYNKEVLGDSGVFVQATSEEIYAGVRAVMSDPDTRDRLRQETIQRARAKFTWHLVCSRYGEVLTESAKVRESPGEPS
ncbi:glycosyltransferase [Amnibacterium sp. CER49]|uniref:glycosyltransferase n=1 Tax=Amnibacterium sp. CER49 TaxID=3039161 RepID=UPI00244B36D5|nr:glycosyltransferase [Amnibacterium sp. CER49]MDH2443004.1 glycosyltransferase [Amnibacterium sp. CER49]